MQLPCILKDELYQMYVMDKMTDLQIANAIGCHKQTVWKHRTRYGIERIPKWSRHECNPTQRQIDIIYGTVIGDAHLDIRNKCRNAESCLGISHGSKQKDYVDWKYNGLLSLTSSSPKTVYCKDGSVKYRFRTFAHPFFSSMRDEFYGTGRKALTFEILNKISPLSVAVWFMDDGTNMNKGGGFRFATCSFTEQEHEMMQVFFLSKYGIKTITSSYSGYLMLRIDHYYRRKFIDLISPHILDCMKYKIEIRNGSKWWCNNEK